MEGTGCGPTTGDRRDCEWIAIGRVRKPFGVKGQFYADAFGKSFSLLKTPCTVHRGMNEEAAAAAVLSEIRKTQRGFICKFEGYDTLTDVESLRGSYLFIERNDLPRLKNNEYYHFELEGMAVAAHPSGRPIGVVKGIEHFPTTNALSVCREDGTMVLIPLRSGSIENIDREHNRITVYDSALEDIVS